MRWLRMVAVAIRLAGPHALMPWRSPLVRWRMETYGFLTRDGRVAHADEVTPAAFFNFVWANRRQFASFLQWAAQLERQS